MAVERWQFSKSQKTQFLQLFPAFLPSHSPPRNPNFFTISGDYFDCEIPTHPPSRTPQHFPFQRGSLRSRHSQSSSLTFRPPAPLSGGWLWGDFGEKAGEYFRNIADFSINFYCSGGASGVGLKGRQGSRWVKFGGNAREFHRPFCEEIRLDGENFWGDGRGIFVMSFAKKSP